MENRGNLKNEWKSCCFLLLFALCDPPSAPFPDPGWSRMGPGLVWPVLSDVYSHVGAPVRARARGRAPDQRAQPARAQHAVGVRVQQQARARARQHAGAPPPERGGSGGSLSIGSERP